MSKITLATIKSFIKKNEGKLYIKNESTFDGMVDCVMPCRDTGWKLAEKSDNQAYHQGVKGAWFVGGSRDYFTPYEDKQFTGYEVYNSCGTFLLAVHK